MKVDQVKQILNNAKLDDEGKLLELERMFESDHRREITYYCKSSRVTYSCTVGESVIDCSVPEDDIQERLNVLEVMIRI